MKFLMFGAPMAGKGTLANMLAEKYHLPTISMGVCGTNNHCAFNGSVV